jgi:threonine dehydrogenase-like Zn-dependent dehydrogenase
MGGPPMDPGAAGGAPMPGPEGGPPGGAPVEQQALQMLAQGVDICLQAAGIDPSIQQIVDGHVKKALVDVLTVYGMAEEAKFVAQQIDQMRQQSHRQNLAGASGPPGAPPGGPPVAPPSGPGGPGGPPPGMMG